MWGSFLIAFQTQRDLARPQTQMGGISAYHTKAGRGRFEGGLFRLLLLETFLWQVLFLIGRKCCVSCTMCLVGRQLWVCVCHCCLLQQPPAELISVSFLSGGAIKSFKYTNYHSKMMMVLLKMMLLMTIVLMILMMMMGEQLKVSSIQAGMARGAFSL